MQGNVPGDFLVFHCATFSAHNMSAILCLVPVPTAPILHPESDLRIHDHISPQFFEDTSTVTPYFFFVFAKNSLIKNKFEEEKTFDSRTWFFCENSAELGVFWLRGLKAIHGNVRKSAIFPPPDNQNGLNEAILLIWIKKLYFRDKILCLSSNQDLILYEGDSNF